MNAVSRAMFIVYELWNVKKGRQAAHLTVVGMAIPKLSVLV